MRHRYCGRQTYPAVSDDFNPKPWLGLPSQLETAMDNGSSKPEAGTADPQTQRDALLDAQRQAHADQPRNFKEDALEDKVVEVGPDGTGPTGTETFDPPEDQSAGSGNDGPKR
jgi:hypothetical protein